jgi:hypothetical protein
LLSVRSFISHYFQVLPTTWEEKSRTADEIKESGLEMTRDGKEEGE